VPTPTTTVRSGQLPAFMASMASQGETEKEYSSEDEELAQNLEMEMMGGGKLMELSLD
jgi:hypothetical protein